MNSRRLIGLIVWSALTWAAPARADVVTYWNAVTIEAVAVGRPGGPGFLEVALVHAATHDAVQAIQQRFEPFAAALKGSGSLDAAAGAAAYGVLSGIYPNQQAMLAAKYKEFLDGSRLTGNPALAIGQQAAAVVLKQHRASTALPD